MHHTTRARLAIATLLLASPVVTLGCGDDDPATGDSPTTTEAMMHDTTTTTEAMMHDTTTTTEAMMHDTTTLAGQ